MKPINTLLTWVAIGFFYATQAWAADDFGRLHFMGYGTLGFNQDDNRPNSTFLRDISQRPRDSFTTSSWLTDDAWLRDSRLGLQIGYQFTPTVSAVSQVVVRNQVSPKLTHFVDWTYLAINPLPELDTRIGRIGYDVFLMSEQRNMSYSYPWVRPPVEFYGWIPLYSVDGADLAYTLRDQETQWRFKLQAGHSPGLGVPIGTDDNFYVKSNKILAATVTRENGPWLLKAGYSHVAISREADPLVNMLFNDLDSVTALQIQTANGDVSGEAAELRRNMTWKNSHMNYFTLGATYDKNDLLAQAELGAVFSSIDMSMNHSMAYVGLAKRMDDWTPYLLVSGIRPHDKAYSASYNWGDGLPPPFAGPLNGLQAGAITALNSTRIHQETLSLGLRWDFNSRAAIKWQLDSTHVHPYGYLLRPTTDVSQALHVNLLSVNLDFTF
ncbi:MAG: hypothetical protein HQL94_10420 [Magnetococcales bacterium]|nr:hypothetical protein [Magnetococcales bacterium]